MILEATVAEPEEPKEEAWQTDGHEFVGKRVRRFFGPKIADGIIISWLPAGEDPEEDPALFRMKHDDEDMEELEVLEVVNAMKYFDRGLEVEPHDEMLQRCKLNNQCEKNHECVRGFKHKAKTCKLE